MDIIKMGRLLDGAPGHDWFFILRILVDDSLSDRDILLGGLAGSVKLLSVLSGFKLFHVDEDKNGLPPVVSHKLEKGFPPNSTIAQMCYSKRFRRKNHSSGQGDQTPVTPITPRQSQKKGYENYADYTGPNKI